MKLYRSTAPFQLERGGCLEELTIAYHTFGKLNKRGDNAVWVCHGLTANSDVADWWPGATDKGSFLDSDTYFVVCANILGSHYGTTGPLSTDPATGKPYYDSFPALTIRDMARAHAMLANHLGLQFIHTLIGASVGGFQALEWAVSEPSRFGKLALIATSAKASPWSIAIDETQRMAIKADATYGTPSPDAAMAGMAAARAIGLLSYRGPYAYNLTQADPDDAPADHLHRPVTYQRYQGEKLCRRFNAYSYVTILDAFDTHNVGRGRGGMEKALSQLTMPSLVVGIDTDIVFTPDETRALAAMLPDCTFREISSRMGHDGFLTEHKQLENIIKPFMTDEHRTDN